MINYLTNFNFNIIAPNHPITAPCPDQLVGCIKNNSFDTYSSRTDIDYTTTNTNIYTINTKLTNPIVIILESPHKDEYDPITNMALGPAMGSTGNFFKMYFYHALNNSTIFQQLNHEHDIILLNAVQYQCSLGLSLSGKHNQNNKKNRDNRFISIINNSANNDLIMRLSAINPWAIINLCTKGVGNLQSAVESLLNSSFFSTSNVYRTTGYHPANWFNPSRRIIK